MKKNVKIWIIVIVVVVLIILIKVDYKLNRKQIACTEEAKLCPDGSTVGRTGPDCEFEDCPGEEGRQSCLSSGGEWGFDECGSACFPKTNEERKKLETGGISCIQVCVPMNSCICPEGNRWGSIEEGCI